MQTRSCDVIRSCGVQPLVERSCVGDEILTGASLEPVTGSAVDDSVGIEPIEEQLDQPLEAVSTVKPVADSTFNYFPLFLVFLVADALVIVLIARRIFG